MVDPTATQLNTIYAEYFHPINYPSAKHNKTVDDNTSNDDTSFESMTANAYIEDPITAAVIHEVFKNDIVKLTVAKLQAEEHLPLQEKEGYHLQPFPHPTTKPNLTTMEVPDSNQSPDKAVDPFDPNVETVAIGDEMKLQGDNNPFIEAMNLAGCLENAGTSPMQTIPEGDETSGTH